MLCNVALMPSDLFAGRAPRSRVAVVCDSMPVLWHYQENTQGKALQLMTAASGQPWQDMQGGAICRQVIQQTAEGGRKLCAAGCAAVLNNQCPSLIVVHEAHLAANDQSLSCSVQQGILCDL